MHKVVKHDAPISIVRDPTDLPPPVGSRGPRRVKVELDTVEVTGSLAEGATYQYWTFNEKEPSPFIHVRVGDTVEVHLKNEADSTMMHNVDFYAVTGPGGGAKATEAAAGDSRSFTFTAINPGLFVYHCAVPMAAQHIANGMYGMILVEPEGGLPKVDHEFYVTQGEIYTEQKLGAKGGLTESYDKLLDERPEYFVFNGATDALTAQKPLTAKVGETVRIYFGVGGPNYTSSFHVIGEVFDRVYSQGSLTSPPLTNVQTTSVPPGGATVVEFKLEVPGKYLLVDHALSRVARGLAGVLEVTGPDSLDVYRDSDPARSAHSTSH
jgi:nitrite reductase (NO-forming)